MELELYEKIIRNNCEIRGRSKKLEENILELYHTEEEIVNNREVFDKIMEEWSEENRLKVINEEINYTFVESIVEEKFEFNWIDIKEEVENTMMKAVEVPPEIVYEMKIEDYKVEMTEEMKSEILRTDGGRQCEKIIVPEQHEIDKHYRKLFCNQPNKKVNDDYEERRKKDYGLKFFREIKIPRIKNIYLWKDTLMKKIHRKHNRKKDVKSTDGNNNGKKNFVSSRLTRVLVKW